MQESNDYYPVILSPKQTNAPVMPTSRTKSCRMGASEIIGLSHLLKLGLNEIRDDLCVSIEGHNYEPDFAYIDPEKGICIDIEIDEPYTTGGNPTHYCLADGTTSDTRRNIRFQNAGWYVIRFSEEQFFCHTDRCMKLVYDLLKAQGCIDEIPQQLARATAKLPAVRHWTYTQARNMHRRGYRRKYLGFNPLQYDIKGIMRCCWLLLPILWQSVIYSRMRQSLYRQMQSVLHLGTK